MSATHTSAQLDDLATSPGDRIEAERSVAIEVLTNDLQQRLADLSSDNARLAEAVEARDAFLAVAAHELRNPMTPILGRVTLLRRAIARGDLSVDEIADRLGYIENLITLFIKRATTLLDLSRIASNQLQVERQPVDICKLAREVAENLQPVALHAGAVLDLDCPTESITVVADRLAVEQVLENLVSNAVKYGEGSPIMVGVSGDCAKGVARITVQDGGPGISELHQTRIFERFERAVQPGTGITGYGVGLWIVRSLCEAMKGTIEVTSIGGMGSTFQVTLPLLTEKDAERSGP